MKVLIAVHHFPPNYNSGAESYTFRLAKWLIEAGYEVSVVCVESITMGDTNKINYFQEIYHGISVWRLYLNIKQDKKSFNQSFDNQMIGVWFAKYLQIQQPHLVHINSCYLLTVSIITAAIQQSIPMILTLHDFWFLCPRITLLKPTGQLCAVSKNPEECAWCLATEKRRFRLPEKMTYGLAGIVSQCILSLSYGAKLLGIDVDVDEIALRQKVLIKKLNQVDLILSPSKFLRNMFIKHGVNSAKIIFSRQGLDIENWITPPELNNTPSEKLRIGYIGQITKHKGVDVLIKAFYRIRNGNKFAKLILYGDPEKFPDFKKQLQKQVQRSKEIVFAGRFENVHIRQIHSEIDVLVVPSIWYENSPNVILEAFAYGTPVVVSNLGGMAELVEDGVNGFQFESGNAKDLAQVLQRFIDHPDLANKLGRGMPAVKTIQEEIQELLHLYTSVIKK